MSEQEHEFSFKSLFVPFTTLKAIHWIIFIGLVVYANMLFNGFVWDDKAYVLANSQAYGLNLPKLFGPNIFNLLGYYRPIPAVYFALIYSIFNQATFFYHFIQLIFHIINTILLFLLLKSSFKRNIAFVLSLIFLVHPMQVESVSYIAQFDSVLFTCLGLIALTLYNRKISFRFYILTFLALLLCLLTKEAGIVFFVEILLFMLFKKYSRRYIVDYVLLSFTAICIYFAIRFLVGNVYFSHSVLVPISALPIWIRVLSIPKIIWYYISTFLIPYNLVVAQNWVVTSINVTNFFLPLLIECVCVFLIICNGLYIFKFKHDVKLLFTYIFYTSWFTFGLLLYLQIFPLDMTVADRWFYFPMIGLLGMIGTVLSEIIVNLTSRNILYVLIGMILCIFSIRTIVRNSDWSSAMQLYTHDSQVLDSYEIEGNLGDEYQYLGNNKEAINHLKRSVAMLQFDTNLNNLGAIYETLGNLKEAQKYYIQAYYAKSQLLPLHKHNEKLYINLLNFYIKYRNFSQADLVISAAIEDYPDSSQFWFYKSLIEYLQHDRTAALNSINQAIKLDQGEENDYQYVKDLIVGNKPIPISF